MLSIFLCVAAVVLCFVAARRSLVTGIGTTLVIGYVYGIVRANVPQAGSHFIFDAAVVGLFAGRLSAAKRDEEQPIPRHLIWWVVALMAWPCFLMAIPKQDMLVQLVGLRGNAFLLPFILLGAQLTNAEKYKLALWCAVLNILAFSVAAAEYQMGISAFFPHNVVTKLIYQSNDVVGHSNYRIPSTFGNAHAYGGTMVMTLPLMLGAWLQQQKRTTAGVVIALSILAASVGVFLSAARSHALLLFAFIGFATVAARMTLLARAGWIALLATVSILVASDVRLQRFMSLSDTSAVAERIGWSVNTSFIDLGIQYPLGNGLGGGGTSIPFFLSDRIERHDGIENEYGRIMMEQGIPGLLLWVAFIFWVFLQRQSELDRGWRNARTLAFCVIGVGFGSAMMGTGLLTSVPQTALFLMTLGWIASCRRQTTQHPAAVVSRPDIQQLVPAGRKWS